MQCVFGEGVVKDTGKKCQYMLWMVPFVDLCTRKRQSGWQGNVNKKTYGLFLLSTFQERVYCVVYGHPATFVMRA